MPITSNVNGLPRSQDNKAVLTENTVANAKLNNQFVLSGSNPEFPGGFPNSDENIICFLEFVQTVSNATFTILDKNGNQVAGTINSPFGDGHAPLRLDGGFSIVANVAIAKGYFLQKTR